MHLRALSLNSQTIAAAEAANAVAMKITFVVLMGLFAVGYVVALVIAGRGGGGSMQAFEAGIEEAQQQVWDDYGIRVTKEQLVQVTEHEMTNVVSLADGRALRWNGGSQRVELVELRPLAGQA